MMNKMLNKMIAGANDNFVNPFEESKFLGEVGDYVLTAITWLWNLGAVGVIIYGGAIAILGSTQRNVGKNASGKTYIVVGITMLIFEVIAYGLLQIFMSF